MIGYGQLLMLFLLGRMFTLMTAVPFTRLEAGGPWMAGILLSTALQGLLLFPVILWARQHPGRSLFAPFEKNGKGNLLLSLTGFVLLLLLLAGRMADFSIYLKTTFSPGAGPLLTAVVLALVCGYGAYLGIQGIARASTVVLALGAAAVVFLAVISIPKASLSRFAGAYGFHTPAVLQAALEDFSRSGEWLAAGVLLCRLRDPSAVRKGGFGSLAGRLVLTEGVGLLLCVVLGGYAVASVSGVQYPFFALGQYLHPGDFMRLDGLYIMLWSLTAVLHISLLLWAASFLLEQLLQRPIRRIFWNTPRRKKWARLVCPVLTALGGAGLSLLQDRLNGEIWEGFWAAVLFLILGILPCLLLLEHPASSPKPGPGQGKKHARHAKGGVR